MLTFNEAEHVYHYDGQPVPNVTSIIENAYDFRFVNADALERARIFGTKVHKTTELHDLGRLGGVLHPKLQSHLASWIQFREDNDVEIIECEKRLYSKKYGYAGTVDRIVSIRGERFVLDIKTGAVYVPHFLQSAGYIIAARENGLADSTSRRCSVYLDEENYEIRFHIDPMDEAAFLGLLTYKKWAMKHGKQRA